jgi:putative ABC transport system permease protein
MSQRIPLSWLQLVHEKMKLLAAIAGVTVSVVLMWMQLGLMNALFTSAIRFHECVTGQLFIVHGQYESLLRSHRFSSRLLYRLKGSTSVQHVFPISFGMADWKNPEDGESKSIQVYGIETERCSLNADGVMTHLPALRETDTFLFDRNARPGFGDITGAWRRGEPLVTEINRRQMKLVGITSLGASFGVDGNLVMSQANFLRLFPARRSGVIDLGIIDLEQHADIESAQKRFQDVLGKEVRVLNRQQFQDLELKYWKTATPIGIIFSAGTVVGFFIGFIVVYQILYTDVTNHLPHYATMKAMGFSNSYLYRLVLRQSFLLAMLGFIPGTILAAGLYHFLAEVTLLPLQLTVQRGLGLIAATLLMCFFSGSLAIRRLSSADPADVF